MKNRKILVVLLSLSVASSLAACANKPAHSDVTAATVSESTTMTEITSIDETNVTESSEEAGAIVKEAKVPEGDIVRVNMDGMTVDAVIANLSNLTKHFDRNNPASYGDIFEVKSPCVYGEVIPKTNMAPYWYFDQDEDMHMPDGLRDIARIEGVQMMTFIGGDVDGLKVDFCVPKEMASDVKVALKDKLLATGAVIASEDDTCIYANPANDISTNYYITTVPYGSFMSFHIEVPCDALK